jgi:D-serine dehydratase
LNVLKGDVALPALVLKADALNNNLRVMAEYSERHGFVLAPHGKTTMSPQLFQRQLAAGAWGMTVANAVQADVAIRAGARHVIVANEVVAEADIVALAMQAKGGAGCEVMTLVDSAYSVERLDGAARRGLVREPIMVLLELGTAHGRAGCRTVEEAIGVARLVMESEHLTLAGVECYEGVIGNTRDEAVLARVSQFLKWTRAVVEALDFEGAFGGVARVIVSAGGSRYFDLVSRILCQQPWALSSEHPVSVVVRAGCYLTHDHGAYARSSPLSQPEPPDECLEPALEIWASVLSTPEAGRVIVGMGRRDVAYDSGLPLPLAVQSSVATGPESLPPGDCVVEKLDDQHAYVTCGRGRLQVGDLVGFGLSHPCTVFDKWRLIPVVDSEYVVVDYVRTLF